MTLTYVLTAEELEALETQVIIINAKLKPKEHTNANGLLMQQVAGYLRGLIVKRQRAELPH